MLWGPGELPRMRQWQIRVQFEFGVKKKFLAALDKLLVSFFFIAIVFLGNTAFRKGKTHIVSGKSLEDKRVLHQKTFHLLSKLLKVFLNDSCKIAFFSPNASLSRRIHTVAENVDKVKCNIIAKSSCSGNFVESASSPHIRHNCFSLCKDLHFHSAYWWSWSNTIMWILFRKPF